MKYKIKQVSVKDAYHDVEHIFIGKIILTSKSPDSNGLLSGQCFMLEPVYNEEEKEFISDPYFAGVIVEPVVD